MPEPTTIADAITAAQGRVADAYTAISNKGGTLPATQNLANMPTAIDSIPGGSSGYSELPSYEISNGVVNRRSKTLTGTDFNNIISINSYGLYYTFQNCTNLIGNVDLSNLTSIGDSGGYRTFQGCVGLTGVDLSSLVTVNNSYACNYMFVNCSNISNINLSSLTTVSGSYGCYYMFSNNTSLSSVSLPSLKTISGSDGCESMFIGCSNLENISLPELKEITSSFGASAMFRSCKIVSITFDKLDTLTGSNACNFMFASNTTIKNIYFPALKTTSFGSTYKNQFSNMLNGTGSGTNHTIHFPSNLSSTISNLTGYPTFGGTSGKVVISFDLTATS